MTLAQLQEKRNKMWADASALVAGDTVTAEQRTQFDAALVEIQAVDGDINRVKAVEEHRASLRNPANQPVVDPSQSNDPEERAEVRAEKQRASLRKWMQTGAVETRDLTISANGGVVVPVGFNPQVIEAQKSYGQIYDIVNVQKTDTGEPIKVVLDDDVTNDLVAIGSGAADTDPDLSGAEIQVSDFTTGAVPVDNSLLQDAGFDLEGFIRDKFMKRFYRGASRLVVAGSGNVASLTATYNTALTVTSLAPTALAYADIVALMTKLDPAYQSNAVFAMNQITLGDILSVLDSNDRPIFLPAFGAADQGFVGRILGYPVKLVTQLPNVAAGAVPILFGDFKAGYTLRQVNPGVVILRNPYSLMNKNQMAFYGFARLGGLATDAGTHPIASLTMHS